MSAADVAEETKADVEAVKSVEDASYPDVFYGNGAPSGPNYLLFVDVDRLADSLWDRSGAG